MKLLGSHFKYCRRSSLQTGILGFFLVIAVLSMVLLGSSFANEKKSITVFNWPDYINPDVIKSFEKTYGIKVKVEQYETDQRRDEILSAAKYKGHDVVVVSGQALDNLVRSGHVAKLDRTIIDTLGYIDKNFLPTVSASENYSVPYLWGSVGIAYRKDLLSSTKISSWKDLFLPTNPSLKGKILMIYEVNDTIDIVLRMLNYPNTTDDKEQYKKVREVLLQQKPYLKAYGYNGINKDSALSLGEIWMAMVYSGDGETLMKNSPDINFILPEEGSLIWIDYLVVMEKSEKKAEAMKFINYLNQPRVAADNASFLNFATPNLKAKEFLPEKHLKNRSIYLDPEYIKKCYKYTPQKKEIQKLRNDIFIKAYYK